MGAPARGQQQRAAQLHGQHLLGGRQRRAERVRAVRAVVRIVLAFPLAHRGDGDVVVLGQHVSRSGRCLDLGARVRGVVRASG